MESFISTCREAVDQGFRLGALTAFPNRRKNPEEDPELLAVWMDDRLGRIGLTRGTVPKNRSYPALSAFLPQAQAFERELFENHGIRPVGHPWLKPLRRHPELEGRTGISAGRENEYSYFRVEGSGVHEVAVGPVHAGIIEPGHFRFQCHGETVLHLEIRLGYQHRGTEDLFLRSGPSRRLAVAESIAGDTAVGHALAYCTSMESLSDMRLPLPALALRGIALELERLANHAGDLGALCNDVGYLPGASWFGRLRGEFLNLLMDFSGNRFGKGLLEVGGVRFGLPPDQRKDFLKRLSNAERDLQRTAEVTFDSPSVVTRFERTGVLPREAAEDLGLVGPAARASGCDRDVRRDHPIGIYRFVHIPPALMDSGDVMARAWVRWLEIQRSLTFAREQIEELGSGPVSAKSAAGRPGRISVTAVEGWRGEILHLAATGEDGSLAGYTFVDPSFRNWFGLSMALRGQQISDFPLCNKSFNLSYAGHDL
jgi:Ni,Fe-hydrogenase III large subunit